MKIFECLRCTEWLEPDELKDHRCRAGFEVKEVEDAEDYDS